MSEAHWIVPCVYTYQFFPSHFCDKIPDVFYDLGDNASDHHVGSTFVILTGHLHRTS